MTYKLCLKLLSIGKLTADMLDVFFVASRLTAEQYGELVEKLSEQLKETIVQMSK